ncbi:MAG: Calx-beta domain-containing protein [Nevskia sp.]|nr:Calx-beta domain-containing protein [Nevskia sp.]
MSAAMNFCNPTLVFDACRKLISALCLWAVLMPVASWAQTVPTLNVQDASIQEGNSGTRNMAFTMTLSPASATTVTVRATTSNGTATSGVDYTGGALTITFAANETSKIVNVGVRGDTESEPDETFFATLSSPTGGAVLGRTQAIGTIVNDDTAADTTPDAFSFTPVTGAATGSVQTSNVITVSGITAASPISVLGGSYSVNGGAFVTTSGTVTVGQTVRVQQTASNTAGATTTATLSIGGVSADFAVTATTAVPVASINDVALVEGNSGTTNAVLTVSLSSASQNAVTVNYATADGTATAGSDYVSTSGTLTFTAGVTSQTVSVGIVGDTTSEGDETVLVNLTAATGATLGDSQGVVTISDDDNTQPTLSVADVSIVEGNSGSKNIIVVVTLLPAAATTTTVRAATSDGTANSSDYGGGSLTLSFPPGATSTSIPLSVKGDTAIEADETFFITLSSPSSGAVIGRGQATATIVDDDGDRIPDAFSFSPVTDVATGSVETSNSIVVSGINTGSPVTVSGGSYSVDGGAFTIAAGSVTVGQMVRVRQTAASVASTATVATLTIGGISANFSVTTAAAGDTVPNAFSFNALTGVEPSSTQTSNAVTITGINVPSPISITGGLYSINGGEYRGEPGTVRPGNVVTVQLTAPFTGTTSATATLTIGGVSAGFRVTTRSVVADSTPDAFSFMPKTDAEPGSEQISNSITVSGITVETPISVTGGSYNVNGGPFGAGASVVRGGDVVSVRVVASSNFLTTRQAVLTIGEVSGSFSVTTKAFVVDRSPDPFTYVSVYSVPRNTIFTSEPVQIRGINVATAISITGGGGYRINGLPLTTAVGTVVNGDIVDVQQRSSTAFGTAKSTVLTVGDYSTTYTVETLAADTHPDAFEFGAVFGAASSTSQSSDEITVAGINTGTSISVLGGRYQIDDGPWMTDAGTVQPGARVRVSAAAAAGSEATARLTIGDVSASFQVLTGSGIVAPSTFSFAARSGFPGLGTVSSTVTISGITRAARVEITGGQYSINGAPYSSATGAIRSGDTLRLLLTPGTRIDDLRTAMVTVGNYTTSWMVATQAPVDDKVDLLRFPNAKSSPINSVVVSPPIPVNGINVPVSIAINSPYTYSLNGGSFTGASGTVQSGDLLRLKVVTGSTTSKNYSVDVSIGQTVINWPVTTVGSVTNPSRFNLLRASAAPGAQVLPGSVMVTQPVFVTNSTGPTAVTVTGGQYSINDGPFTAAAGTVVEGDKVVVRLVMPSTYETIASVTLNLGATLSTLSATTTKDPVASTLTMVANSSANYVLRTDAIVPLRAFVFNPPNWQPTDRRAAYIDWTGGGWARGGLPGGRSRYWATDQGMVVISPDQRVNDRFGTYAYVHADDARLVLRWAQENAAQLGIDPTRIVVTGTSSGGGNAVWASLLEPPVTTSFRNNPLFRVGAVVLKSGVSSTAADAQLGQSQIDRFGAFGDTISPDRGLDSRLSPYLIFHGDADLVFAQTANLRVCTSIRAMGRVCEFVNEAGLGHEWLETPGKQDESRAQELDFYTRTGILPAIQ